MNLTLTILLLTGALAILFPAGMALWSGGLGRDARRSSPDAPIIMAVALGVAGYFSVGFALQYGGATGLYPALGELAALRHEWVPFIDDLGRGWGLLGLDGFFLAFGDDAGAYSLFFFQAVLLAGALSIPAAAWAGRIRSRTCFLYAIFFSLFLYPILGNWVWGGGWLAQLGRNLGLGHGLVDFAGAGVVHVLGGMAALAGAVVLGRRAGEQGSGGAGERGSGGDGETQGGQSAIANLPSAICHLPSTAGALLMALGWLAILAGGATLWGVSLPVVLVNALVAAACAATVALAYMGFATGQADSLMASRGLLAGLAAISATAPFVSPPAAALIGTVAGLLVCLGTFVVEHALRLEDPLGAISSHGLGGLWGLLALGVLAEGRVGAGWNGVGLRDYLGVASQGVTGLLSAPGFLADTQQIVAQLAGMAALTVWGFGLSFIFLQVMQFRRPGKQGSGESGSQETRESGNEGNGEPGSTEVSEQGSEAIG